MRPDSIFIFISGFWKAPCPLRSAMLFQRAGVLCWSLKNIPLRLCRDGFTHQSADRASRCSCILATVSYDVINTGGKMCLRSEFSISLSNFRSRRAESYSSSTSSDLFGAAILPVLAVMLTCALSTNSVQGLLSLHSSQSWIAFPTSMRFFPCNLSHTRAIWTICLHIYRLGIEELLFFWSVLGIKL